MLESIMGRIISKAKVFTNKPDPNSSCNLHEFAQGIEIKSQRCLKLLVFKVFNNVLIIVKYEIEEQSPECAVICGNIPAKIRVIFL